MPPSCRPNSGRSVAVRWEWWSFVYRIVTGRAVEEAAVPAAPAGLVHVRNRARKGSRKRDHRRTRE